MRPARKDAQRGLSLIELMISITLGLVVLAALLGVFTQNSRSFRQNDAVAQMQDSARFALDTLARDISMAGFYGGMYGASNVVLSATATTPTPDCGALDTTTGVAWAYQLKRRVEFRNHTAGGAVASQFPCLGQSTTPVAADTDVLAIRRVAGQPTADLTLASATSANVRANNFYLKTNGTAGSIVRNGGSAAYTLSTGVADAPALAPMTFYKYVPRVYFIRSYSQVSADAIPTLCRMELQQDANPSMQVECLADGVENLQVEWGLDLDNDCVVDTYTSNPDADQLAQFAITARIWLLVRTTQIDAGYSDPKTFSFGDYSTTAPLSGAYHRRVYSTTVQLRNPIGDNGPCSGPAPT